MSKKIILALPFLFVMLIFSVFAQENTTTTVETTTETTTPTTIVIATTTTPQAVTSGVEYWTCTSSEQCVRNMPDGSILIGECASNYCQNWVQEKQSTSWIPDFLKPKIKHGPLSPVLDIVLMRTQWFDLTVRYLLLTVFGCIVIFFFITHIFIGICLLVVWLLMAVL